MKVQTFIGKVSVDGLRQMDNQINRWLEEHKIEPRFIHQNGNMEKRQDSCQNEPVVITSIWY